MTDIANLVLKADTRQLKAAKDDLRGVSDEANRTTKSVKEIGAGMMKLGGALTLGVTAPLAAFGKGAFDAAIQAREAFAQVEAALSSMGGASGKTAEELKKSAKQLETFSNFDDGEILQKVTANMLTFGNVSGEAFDRAQQAAVDLSARMEKDLQSSTIMIGKALNDPVTGLGALSEAGIKFTDEQKDLIKAMSDAGDVAGAQALMLAELETQFGGAAKAARDAAPGGDQAQAWRTLQEVIGEKLVVAFEELERVTAPIINAFLGLDENTQTVIVVVAALAAALGPLLVVLGSIVLIAPAIATGLGAVKVAMLGIFANPIILAAAAVITGIYLAWQNWDAIKDIVSSLGQAVSDWYSANVKPAIDGAMSLLEPFVDFFQNVFQAAITGPLEFISKLLTGDFSGAWSMYANAVEGAASFISNIVSSVFNAVGSFMGDMLNAVVSGASNIVSSLVAMGGDMIAGLVNGIQNSASAVWNALKGVIMGGVEWAKDFLGIASPSKLFAQYGEWVSEGFAIGIEAGKPMVDSALGGLGEGIEALGEKAATQTVQIKESFKDMAEGVLGALQNLSGAIKGGGFLDILGGVLNLFLQIGSTGLLGKGLAGSINSSPTNMSQGGTVSAGQPYMVGERGPEKFVPPHSGRIVPNNGNQAVHVTVGIDPRNGNVTAFVDGRIVATAPQVASAGAALAQSQLAQSTRSRYR